MTGKLTEKQRAALETLSARKHGGIRFSASELGHSAAVLGSLARLGFVLSRTQTVNPLHEPAYSYQLYEITSAGRAALEPQTRPNQGEGS